MAAHGDRLKAYWVEGISVLLILPGAYLVITDTNVWWGIALLLLGWIISIGCDARRAANQPAGKDRPSSMGWKLALGMAAAFFVYRYVNDGSFLKAALGLSVTTLILYPVG